VHRANSSMSGMRSITALRMDGVPGVPDTDSGRRADHTIGHGAHNEDFTVRSATSGIFPCNCQRGFLDPRQYLNVQIPEPVLRHRYILVALAVVLAYLAPFYIMWDQTPCLAADNLDQNVVWNRLVAEDGYFLSPLDTVVPQIMNGLSRNALETDLSVMQWLHQVFDPYTAYVINVTLIHLAALFSMYLLLRRHFLPDERCLPIVAGVSLAFALLPFWPPGGLTIAGMPLLFYALLNFRAGSQKAADWAIIALLPFYSCFFYTGIFVIVAFGLVWLYDLAVTRRVAYPFLAALVLLGAVYLLVEYRILYLTFLDPAFVSHRTAYQLANWFKPGLSGALSRSAGYFLFSDWQILSLHQYFVLAAVLLAGTVYALRRQFDRTWFWLIAAIAAFSVVAGFYYSDILDVVLRLFPLYPAFDMRRFFWLSAVLWYLLFAVSLGTLYRKAKGGKYLVYALLLLQILYLFTFCGQSWYDITAYQAGGTGVLFSDQPSFEEYYSEELFAAVRDYIGTPQEEYRVASIGLHPGIALYNGFYTLDGYLRNYQLEYKMQFREVVAAELEKDLQLHGCFDNWGSRCIILSTELENPVLGYWYTKDQAVVIHDLDLNTAALYEMGGRYILSAVEIENYRENGLELLEVFEDESSPYRIWLYRIEVPGGSSIKRT
jgi:hypothetical protein